MDISIKLPFEQLLGIIKNLNQKEKEEELVDRIVKDVVIRYKREYIIKIINDLKYQITEENSEDAYRKIINLTQLKNKIDEKLYRIL